MFALSCKTAIPSSNKQWATRCCHRPQPTLPNVNDDSCAESSKNRCHGRAANRPMKSPCVVSSGRAVPSATAPHARTDCSRRAVIVLRIKSRRQRDALGLCIE